MWISEGELKTQVAFGTYSRLEVAVQARDMAILAFRSDCMEEVKQSDEWVERVVCCTWDNFWSELGGLKENGRRSKGGGESTQALLKAAWVVSHKTLAGRHDKLSKSACKRASELARAIIPPEGQGEVKADSGKMRRKK